MIFLGGHHMIEIVTFDLHTLTSTFPYLNNSTYLFIVKN
jgi:hypothetical protein